MRVLITGAAGTLGRAVAPLLAAAGHEPVLFDVVPLETAFEFVQGDVRNMDDTRRAVSGAEAVIHAAAIHGIHLRDHTPSEFYDLNLTGTFNVWEAAVAAGVKALVFSSTMGVYGESRAPSADDAVVVLDEDVPLLPTDVYGYTKVAGEEMCRYYLRRHGIPSVALRFGMFVPEPFFRYGIRLLYGGVDTDDVAAAVVASMEALTDGGIRWGAFNIESFVPFTAEDGAQLRRDPLRVLDRYYPRAAQLLRERGVERLQPIDHYYPMTRIEQELGFRPACNFDTWLEELKARPGERAPNATPWP